MTFRHENEIFREFGEPSQAPMTLYTNDAEAAEILPRMLDSDFSRVLFGAV